MSKVSIGMGRLMLFKVHLACWVFNLSTFSISLPVAVFITLVGGETQSKLLWVQVYFVPSRSRVVSFMHWKAILDPSWISKTSISNKSFWSSFLWAVLI